MHSETKTPVPIVSGKSVYAFLMSVLLLGYLLVIATYKDGTTTGQVYILPIQFWILRIVTGVMAICLGKLWKDKGFLVLLAYLLLKAVRVICENPSNLFTAEVSESLLTGFWVFSACYGLAKILDQKKLRQFITANAIIWTIGIVAYSVIGLYAAWTNQYVYNLGRGSFWGVMEQRLYMVYYVTTSGSVLSTSIVIALAGAAITRNKIGRILFILAILPMLVALSLTDSRGPQISAAAGIGTMAGILLLKALQARAGKADDNSQSNQHKQTKQTNNKPWIPWLAAIATSVVVFIGIVLLCRGTISLFNHAKTTGIMIPRAYAETAEVIPMSNRGFLGDNVLTDRQSTWNAVLQIIGKNPMLLLTGTSIHNPMAIINESGLVPYQMAHCHNMPLMILLENGIPGLLLAGAFLAIVIRKAYGLLNNSENPWQTKLIPIIIAICVGELVECFVWIRTGQVPTLSFFIVAAGIIVTTEQAKT